MKIGFCAKPAQVSEIANAGYDYMEPPVNAIAGMETDAFQAFVRQTWEAGIATPSFNLLYPKNLALLDPATEDSQITAYLSLAFERVQRLGGTMVVFGSGKSRMRPENMSYGEAFLRLAAICRLSGMMADRFGLTIAIEPLNRSETNMICSLPEAADLAAAAAHPRIRVLADYYHMCRESEPMEEIERIGGVVHAHIATSEGRLAPVVNENGFKDFFKALKTTGFDGCLSVEGKCENMAEGGPITVKLLLKLWEEA
ncbi:MAG: sugar phosphate isomerase/epimerase [Clostridia bacterium]|nr:sugar phosphate isomerase/epimerase [Clostridia bacterium]